MIVEQRVGVHDLEKWQVVVDAEFIDPSSAQFMERSLLGSTTKNLLIDAHRVRISRPPWIRKDFGSPITSRCLKPVSAVE